MHCSRPWVRRTTNGTQIRWSTSLAFSGKWTFEQNKAKFQERAGKLKPVVLPKRIPKEAPSDLTTSSDKSGNLSSFPVGFAVLVPLCTFYNIPCILFTLRSSHLTKHRGEISFPGGRAEPEDMDTTAAALRETEEEIGVCPGQVDVWSVLPSFPTRNMEGVLTPVVGHLGPVEKLSFVPHPSEVEQIFLCSLAHLCSSDNRGYTSFRSRPPMTMPVFRTGSGIPDWKYQCSIWGMTAMITNTVLTCLSPEVYKQNYSLLTPTFKTLSKT